jgi:hypothetical protein
MEIAAEERKAQMELEKIRVIAQKEADERKSQSEKEKIRVIAQREAEERESQSEKETKRMQLDQEIRVQKLLIDKGLQDKQCELNRFKIQEESRIRALELNKA